MWLIDFQGQLTFFKHLTKPLNLGAPSLNRSLIQGWEPRTSTALFSVTEIFWQLIPSPPTSPMGFDFHSPDLAGQVVTKARPRPTLRLFEQTSLDGIPMHITKYLDALLFVMHIEIVIPPLPELDRAALFQLARGLLLQHLKHN